MTLGCHGNDCPRSLFSPKLSPRGQEWHCRSLCMFPCSFLFIHHPFSSPQSREAGRCLVLRVLRSFSHAQDLDMCLLRIVPRKSTNLKGASTPFCFCCIVLTILFSSSARAFHLFVLSSVVSFSKGALPSLTTSSVIFAPSPFQSPSS